MAENASSIQWLLSQQTEVRYLPDTAFPIRATFKSEDELQQLAHEMAEGKKITLPEFTPFDFSHRLTENSKLILHAFRATDAAVRNNETITPAAQWLLDNHYTIDKTVQQTRRDFPRSFVKQLPPYKGETELPRIFALAWLYVAHTDSSFSLPTLTAMVKGYQQVTDFQIGEL